MVNVYGNFKIIFKPQVNFGIIKSHFLFITIEPPSFIDNSETLNSNLTYDENSVFVKNINEFDDFSLKCLARGKPKPKVSWFLKYFNGTSIRKDFMRYIVLG